MALEHRHGGHTGPLTRLAIVDDMALEEAAAWIGALALWTTRRRARKQRRRLFKDEVEVQHQNRLHGECLPWARLKGSYWGRTYLCHCTQIDPPVWHACCL